MTAVLAEVRTGAYYDSVVLMQLQRSLSSLPGVSDAGVVMGTDANKKILSSSGLSAPAAMAAGADDLVIAVKAETAAAAQAALSQVDSLLTARRGRIEQDYLPKSLESALESLPSARWVLVSVPGRYAAGVARQALRLGRNVFLYSDNVSVEDEQDLKRQAATAGLLLMGPDCGTAIVNGVGLGFANRVRRGAIGLVAASGTGLQQVSARIHQLGGGLSHALGTGGRDLSEAVGALGTQQCIDLFRRDPDTQVIVLVSKPPSPAVAGSVLRALRQAGKPAIIDLIGYPVTLQRVEKVHFASTFDDTAELAVRLAREDGEPGAGGHEAAAARRFAPGQKYLRGLFSGGTLAYEAQLLLQDYLEAVYSNAPLHKEYHLANSLVSQGHTIVDLGEDEFTVGRLHPMMDNDLRLRRLEQEAADPAVAVILLDVVLGYGAHPDPASELAPAVAAARKAAKEAGRHLEFVAVVVGTDQDPQGLESQVARLQDAGAHVETSNDAAVRRAGRLVASLDPLSPIAASPGSILGVQPVDPTALTEPVAAVNVGLESFADSLRAQGAAVVQVDWRPPAGGNERLMAILERMRRS